MEPPPVDLVAPSAGGGRDELLPEPPNRPERWQLIGIAVALVVLAGLAVRVLASAPDDPPRPAPTVTPSASVETGTTGELRVGAPPDVFPVDPSDVHLFPVGCNQPHRTCVLQQGVPAPFLRAVRGRFPGIVTERASITRAGEPVAGDNIIFDFLGHVGVRTVSISVRPNHGHQPNYAGTRRSGGGQLDVYAETNRDGYRIQIDVLAPPGRTPPGKLVWRLSLDPRLRP